MDKSSDILTAAISVFAEKGDNATISEIAKRAQVTESAIYKRYKSKTELLILIFQRFWEKLLNFAKGVRGEEWAENTADKIKKIITLMNDFLYQDPNLVKVVAGVSLIPPENINDNEVKNKRLEVRRINREFLITMDEIIREGQEKEQITDKFKAQVIRQALIGIFQQLSYGTFIGKARGEDVGYTALDAMEIFNYFLESIEKK